MKENSRNEILILTQDPSILIKEDALEDLKKELEKKTGKSVVILPPGATLEILDLDTA